MIFPRVFNGFGSLIEGLLGRCWGHLQAVSGPSWGHFGLLRGHLRATLGYHRPLSNLPGAFLGPRRPETSLERVVLGAKNALSEPFVDRLEVMLGLHRAILGHLVVKMQAQRPNY